MPSKPPGSWCQSTISALVPYVVGRRGPDLGAFADRDDAEAIRAAQAPRDHVEIARLEHAQREPSARQEHRLQRKQRQLAHPTTARMLAAQLAAVRPARRCSSSRGKPWKLPFDISTT